jgi:hypothetical protein
MNKYFSDLQTKMVEKHKMGDRIQVNILQILSPITMAQCLKSRNYSDFKIIVLSTSAFRPVLIGWQLQVICADIRNQKEILAKADVIILHNVFECFVTENQLPELWKFFQNATLKNKGCKIISVPALQKSLANAKVMDPPKRKEFKRRSGTMSDYSHF